LLRAIATIGLPIEAMQPLHRWEDLIKAHAMESDTHLSELDNYDFSRCRRVVDVGGNTANLLAVAGLTVTDVISTSGCSHIIEAAPA